MFENGVIPNRSLTVLMSLYHSHWFENGVIPNRSLDGLSAYRVILAIGCGLVVISGLDFLFPKNEKVLSLGNRFYVYGDLRVNLIKLNMDLRKTGFNRALTLK